MNYAVVAIILWTGSEQIMIESGSRVTYGAYEEDEFGQETFTYKTKQSCPGFFAYEDIFFFETEAKDFPLSIN
jgi:hypothetical protein